MAESSRAENGRGPLEPTGRFTRLCRRRRGYAIRSNVRRGARARDRVLERAFRQPPHGYLDVVGVLGDDRRLTLLEARLHGIFRSSRFGSLFCPAYGGAFATARGYGKLLSDLLREHSRVLSDTSRHALLSSEYHSKGHPLGVTLAFREGDLDGARYLSKPGGGPGVSGNMRLYPARGIATVFLSNTMRVSESAIQEVSDGLDRAFVAGRGDGPRTRQLPSSGGR